MDQSANPSESRRDVLKKLAAGGALVWTTPVILSTPAFAASGTPAATTSTTTTLPGPDGCAGLGDWQCGDPIVICGEPTQGIFCACERDVEGNAVCVENLVCGALPTCTASSQCPSGWVCVDTGCCPGMPTVCLPLCGAPESHAQGLAGGGPTAFGV